MSNFIFVFGSNLAGRHGKGAALCAAKDLLDAANDMEELLNENR